VHAVTATLPSRPAPGRGTDLRSCLYEGTVGHRRRIDVGHGFSQPIVLAYLDLDQLDDAFAAHPLWSTSHPAPVRFRRSDMHGDPDVPLADAVRATLAADLGTAPAGPVRVLTHLRHWAWTFNPISLYFAFDAADTRVEAVLAEVTNTPWHERRAYALAAPPPAEAETTGIRFAKDLHVSPFMDLDLDHVLRFSPPGADRLVVEMDDERRDEGCETVFSARMVLRRLPLDRASMGHVLRHHRLPAHRVSAGIHLNALRLWRKGAPFRRHPKHHGAPA
jgi:DUF1365 family protein